MEPYLPLSPFLLDIVEGRIEIEGSPEAEDNLFRLLGFVHDSETSNRDWATFIIAQSDADTADLRSALILAADDPVEDVRDEAIFGLAKRAHNAALSKLQTLLNHEIGIVLLKAAEALGDPSLVPQLEAIKGWEGGGLAIRKQLDAALDACRSGVGCLSVHESGLPGYRLLGSKNTATS